MNSKVSPNWTIAPLSDVAVIVMGQSPDSSTYNGKGNGLPFFQGKAEFGALYPSVRKWCSAPTKIAESGDILLSVRAPVGPTNLSPEQCCIGRGLAAIRAYQPLDQKYLLHHFRSIEPWLSEQGTGTTFKAISGEFIRSIEISIAPLNEQRRIADKLDQTLAIVERALERLRRVPEILKRFRQSVLAAATDGRLTEDWRAEQAARMLAKVESAHYVRDAAELRYQVTSSPDSASSQPSSDSDWPEQTLADVASIIAPNPSHRYPSYENGTVPIIATEQLKGRDGYDLSRAKLVNPSFHDERVAAHGFEAYDIVFARKGRLGLARKPPVGGKYVFSHTIFLVRAKDPSDAEYLLWYLRNEQCIAWLLQEMNSNQGVPTLGKSFMQKLPVKMPPKDEQTEIVRRVEALFALADRIQARHQAALARVEKLTQALLAKAFRGELVPQDPADEPAAALLERIRAARAAGPVSRGRGRKVAA